MRWVTGILMVIVTSSAAAQQVDVTLSDAIQRALLVQPGMVQAQGGVRTANAQRLASNGAFLPTVSVGGGSSRSGGSQIVGNQIVPAPARTSFSGTLTANWDLFTGFRRIAARRASGALQEAADAGLISQRYTVILQTKVAFYNAIATEELVRVADAQVARTRQQLQISTEKLRAGSATRSDSLRSVVELGNAQIALLQAQANFAFAQATLGRQIGIDSAVRAVPDSALPPAPDTTGLRETSLSTAPEVRQTEAQARAARAQVWISRSAYWPTFSTTVSKGSSGGIAPWTSTAGYLDNWAVRFSVNLTLFNGFVREQGLTNSSVTRDNAEAVAADTRRQVNATLTQAIAALRTALAQLDISRANVAAATEDMRVQQERYRVGAATILDLLTSQASLTQALVNQVQTRFNYLVSRATLEALVGREL
jgi:outer membrane protein TolC